MKKFFFLVVLSGLALQLSAQRYSRRDNLLDRMQIMGGVGMVNFLGELGGADDIGTNFLADFEFAAIRPVIHVGYRFKYTHWLAQKATVSYGWITGDDKWTNEAPRLNRNLYFRSPLLEWGTTVELYFLPDNSSKARYKRRGVYGRKGRPVLGYVFGGVAGFWFDPTAVASNGQAYSLQPLGTEGQGIIPTREKYSRVGLSIPVGFGFAFKINDDWGFEVEAGYRKTFTDYMDDVSLTYIDKSLFSDPIAAELADPTTNLIPGGTNPGQQRGDPNDKDAYLFLQFSATYKLGFIKRSKPKFR